MSDKKGRVLVLDARIDDSDFLFISIYNANMEKEQASVLNELITILSNFKMKLNLSKQNECNKGKGKGLWKFDNSLISNTD